LDRVTLKIEEEEEEEDPKKKKKKEKKKGFCINGITLGVIKSSKPFASLCMRRMRRRNLCFYEFVDSALQQLPASS